MTTCECSLLHTEPRADTCSECGTTCCRSCALEIETRTYCRWCATALQPVLP